MFYLSSFFRHHYSSIYSEISKHIQITELNQTKDIWLRDFMPVKNSKGKWILFNYFPKYLKHKNHYHLITDNRQICETLKIDYYYSDLILDGGSIVYNKDEYFISDRVLSDNTQKNASTIITELQNIFETDKVYLMPCDPDDFTGHLDGILAFKDPETIVISDMKEPIITKIKKQLATLKKNIVPIPYNPYSNKTYQSAKGVYVNFVIHENKLFLPIFGMKEDEAAQTILSTIFPIYEIIAINCNTLASQGGLLHCISWESDARIF